MDNEPYSIAEQRTITDGRIVPVGKSFTRRPSKRVDYLLRYRRGFNIAVVEAKPEYKTAADGLQQAKELCRDARPTRFVDMTALKRVNTPDEVAEPFIVQNDDVFIVGYNGDINRVAKPAIHKGANESRVVYPDKLMRLRPEQTKLTPDFLVFALSARGVREQIEQLGKTTPGNIGVSGKDAKSFRVPLPPLPEQRRMVVKWDALQAEVDALKRLQAESAAEIDALLPSILDKASKTSCEG